MALFKIFKGSDSAKITTPSATGYKTPVDGYAYYDTRTKLFYIDAQYPKANDPNTFELRREPINAQGAMLAQAAIYDDAGNEIKASYVKNTGDTMSGDLNFSQGSGNITWNSATWQQRIKVTDDAIPSTSVFTFQQSSNSGSTWADLATIRDDGVVVATTFSGSLSGNASTATILQTGRNINGTFFNGSADITTANWGTSRGITVGNKTISVNGSTDYTWSLHDILYNTTTIGATTSWDQTVPGVYYVASSSEFTGTNNPENTNTNNGIAPYRYGQLIVSKANNGGMAEFYISHNDSNNDSYGIHYRTGWNNNYVAKWSVLLDSGNYTKWTVKKDGTGASGSWGISITGNAATATSATKATQDASGNTITSTYLTKAAGVTNVAWDTTNKKITKTINDSTTDVVALSTLLASAALTGTPTAPTAATGTNTTQIATTAFVNTAITNAVPQNLGHTLTIGTYEFDGSADVTIPIYDGTVI